MPGWRHRARRKVGALGLMGVSVMDAAVVRVRSVAWVATAVVLSVVCTLLVTQAWSVGAAPGDDDSTFVPTAGCRLVDTRPAPRTVGPRSAPLGAGDIFEVKVHGSNGECTGGLAIPSDAVAVALNVTAVNATASSNIRLYPANLTKVPLLSNLNVTAGAPATPNKVDVKLSPDGRIRVFNFNGSVNVILDVVGYYTNSTLQELSQRVAGLEAAQAAGVDPAVLARIDAVEASAATNASDIASNTSNIANHASDIATNMSNITTLDAVQPFTVVSPTIFEVTAQSTTNIRSVTVTAPVAGQVAVFATGFMFEGTDTNGEGTDTDGEYVLCGVMDSVTDPPGGEDLFWQSPVDSNSSHLSGSRVFDIAADEEATYYLVCRNASGGSSSIRSPRLTAIFTPAP